MTYYASWPFLALEIADEAARICDVVRSANAPNFRGAREYFRTDLDMPQWKDRATFHGDDYWIMDCIQYGFHIKYTRLPLYEPPSTYKYS